MNPICIPIWKNFIILMVYKDQFCINEYVQGKLYVLKLDLALAIFYALKHNP